jgi:hypothetical protein
MGPRPSVKNIPNNMQVVDDHALDQMAQSNNKFLRPVYPYDRMDNLIIISFFILDFRLFRN